MKDELELRAPLPCAGCKVGTSVSWGDVRCFLKLLLMWPSSCSVCCAIHHLVVATASTPFLSPKPGVCITWLFTAPLVPMGNNFQKHWYNSSHKYHLPAGLRILHTVSGGIQRGLNQGPAQRGWTTPQSLPVGIPVVTPDLHSELSNESQTVQSVPASVF